MVEVIARGEEVRCAERDGAVRAVLEYANYQAVLTRMPRSNSWILSGWGKERRGRWRHCGQ
jgi:hypothetical protein